MEATRHERLSGADLLPQVRELGIRLVRFLYVDNGGIIRGKTTHVNHLASRVTDGIGLTKAMQAMNILDQLADVPGLGPVGEIRLVPDPETFRVLPYCPHSAAMSVDMRELDGSPWAACPRSFLKRQIQTAAADGLAIQAAFECEYSLLTQGSSGMYEPLDRSLCFSTVGMTNAADVIDETIAALELQGISVEQYYPELGHGQQELSIRHSPALTAADNQVVYRETVRNVARRHGLTASLAPKPFVDQAGNGAHLHFSVWDVSGNRNLFHDPSGSYGLSRLAYSFIAGVLAHLPGLLALTCASVNSYRRLQPSTWSSAYPIWGPDNREAAVRVASGYDSSPEASANCELKASDASSNPYLALGGLIAAGLDGVRRQLEPDQPVLVDPSTFDAGELARRGIKRYPASLGEALDHLEHDETLTTALGPLLTQAFLAVKRLEVTSFGSQGVEYELAHHLEKF